MGVPVVEGRGHLGVDVEPSVGLEQHGVVADHEEVFVELLVGAGELVGFLDGAGSDRAGGGLGEPAELVQLFIAEAAQHQLAHGEFQAHAGVQLGEAVLLAEVQPAGLQGGDSFAPAHRVAFGRDLLRGCREPRVSASPPVVSFGAKRSK